MTVVAPKSVDFLGRLDQGEALALSLARERGAGLLLIDERAGTEVAREMGFLAIGTLGILIEGGAEGLLDFEDALQRLTTQTPFYASRRLMDAARDLYRQRART